jgi:diacylglycerol kinase family enzyme
MTAAAIPVIVNEAAGRGHHDGDIEALLEAFRAAGGEARVFAVRGGDDMVELTRGMLREGHAVVVAGGGDGTVSTVASVVAGSNAALGVLPLGTLNHFAKDLGIPLTLEGAARTIVANHQARVDVGEVNGHKFINNSSLGMYPTMVAMRERRRRRLGWSKLRALLWASLTVLRRHPMLAVRLVLDDLVEERRTPLVFIGNNEYVIEGFDVGSRVRLDGGLLSIYVTRRHGRRGLIGLALRALVGTLRQADDFEALTAHSTRIATRHRHLLVATDGEVNVMETPLDYRIHPKLLRVIVPAPAGAAGAGD